MAYATLNDLATFGANASALTMPSANQTAALNAASAEADGYLRSRYPRAELPLTTYSVDLTIAVVKIAVFELLAARGFDPNANSDDVIVKRADDARAWLKSIARGEVSLDLAPDPATSPGSPTVNSQPLRGW